MAAVAATTSCAVSAATGLVRNTVIKSTTRPAGVNGLPVLSTSRLVCSAEKKEVASLPMLAASGASFAAFAAANPGAAFALVDERLSTEGTGLGLGLSDGKLTWVLIVGTALIWALYFAYSSTLPEGDDDSGLSL